MFEPLNEGHAISEVTFIFEFEQLSTATLHSMLNAYPSVAEVLPSKQDMPGMIVEQSSAGIKMNQVPGAEWAHYRADGKKDWLARVTRNAVTVHCNHYSGWSDVWEKAYTLLSAIFEQTKGQFVPVANIGLQYIDRFDFKGSRTEYDSRHLVREDSVHFARQILDRGTRWHNYSGWFEYSKELDREILQQLNIDAIEQDGTALPIVSLTHTSLLRAKAPGDLDKYRHFTHLTESPIARFMQIAHDNNHSVLREVLTPDILARIGVGVEE